MLLITNNYSIGKRKRAIAKVILTIGTGILIINKKKGSVYFQNNFSYLIKIKTPFYFLGIINYYDIFINVSGGGLTSQMNAIFLGIARALAKINNIYSYFLKKFGFLTRNSKIVEKKKYGLKKARKDSQYSKR